VLLFIRISFIAMLYIEESACLPVA